MYNECVTMIKSTETTLSLLKCIILVNIIYIHRDAYFNINLNAFGINPVLHVKTVTPNGRSRKLEKIFIKTFHPIYTLDNTF